MNPFKKDFPILKNKLNNKPLVYLDNAATAHKPQVVLDAVNEFYTEYNANIHRGIHSLSQKATKAVEHAREQVQKLIKAKHSSEVIFTYGTTTSVNTVAYAWAERTFKDGDEILLSKMEHHGNTVPWMELAKRKNIKLSYVPVTTDFQLDYDAMENMVSKKTKLISLVHISNVLGTRNDIERIVAVAKKVNAKVLIDAAQGVPRELIDVQNWNIDFLAFSGHKMYGPTGIGILYIKKEIADVMEPFIGGGGAIAEVDHDKGIVFQESPEKFEAGTPNIAGMIGLGAAVQYLMDKGIHTIAQTEQKVARYGYDELSKIDGLKLYCPPDTHGVLTFTMQDIHPHDIAEVCNQHGVCIRSGHHCAMPIHTYLGLKATARASLGCYNTKEDIDTLVTALKDAQKKLT